MIPARNKRSEDMMAHGILPWDPWFPPGASVNERVWKNTLAVFLLLHHVSEPLLRDSSSKDYVRRADAHAASQNVSVMEAETTPCIVLLNSSTLENPFNGCDQ